MINTPSIILRAVKVATPLFTERLSVELRKKRGQSVCKPDFKGGRRRVQSQESPALNLELTLPTLLASWARPWTTARVPARGGWALTLSKKLENGSLVMAEDGRQHGRGPDRTEGKVQSTQPAASPYPKKQQVPFRHESRRHFCGRAILCPESEHILSASRTRRNQKYRVRVYFQTFQS